jgi:uncharacterized protein YdeI (YjbR/CyaY-like superfamily)
MVATDDKPVVYCASAEEWRAWLAQHHADSDGVRLQLRKKASTLVGIMYPDALDEALCFGWIDGQTVSLDGDFFLQVFTRVARGASGRRSTASTSAAWRPRGG